MSKFSLRTKRVERPENLIVVTEDLIEKNENITFSNNDDGSKYITVTYFDKTFTFSSIKDLIERLGA